MTTTTKANHKSYRQVKEYADRLASSVASSISQTHDRNGKVYGMKTGSHWVYLNCENADNMFVFDERLSRRWEAKLGRVAVMRTPGRTYKSSYTGFNNKGIYPPGKSHSGIAWHFENWRDLFDILEGKV